MESEDIQPEDHIHDRDEEVYRGDGMDVDVLEAQRPQCVASRKGWLPPPDDGSRAETPGADAPVRFRPAVSVAGGDVVEDEYVNAIDEESLGLDLVVFMAMQLGGRKPYSRDRRRAARHMVSEVFSPPRVTAMLSRFPNGKLAPGVAFDITCNDPLDGQPWNFDMPSKRERARKILREQRPLFLIGSPDCTAFSSWQNLSRLRRDSAITHREYVRAMVHLRFCCQLYREQLEGGRYFLHEHPECARAWGESCIKELMDLPEVDVSKLHACQYGMAFEG